MGSNCCKGDASRPIRSTSSIYSRSRAGASLDDRFTTSDDAGGVRLTVSTAQTGDSGVYTLQASNAAGSATSKIRLEVSAEETPTGEDPPTFLRRLQDLTVKVGSRTRFLVEIISSTECKVTWYRNERRLLEAERVALARDGNFWCADVAAVSVDDAGRWTCTAENAGGRASCSAHLNVLVPKAYKRPEFVEELRALLTEQGTVSLECKVVGVPTPVLRWFKDSREIKAGDVFALTANAEDPTSLGTYTCEAVNCMGRAYSSSKVHVVGRASREGSARPSSSGMTPEPPPIFTKELEDAHVKVCEHLTLGCHIVVPPWPRSIVWYNKEGKVEPGERYHVIEDGVGGYLLEITSTEWADEGEWKCVATSAGGRVGISTCYVAMDVPKNYRKPRFMENLQAVLTEEGLVSFECKVVGFPTPVLSWFKDGQELKPGDVYQLTGTNSLGSYCCIARNCMGQASSSAELTVEDIQNQLNEEEKLQLFSKNQAPKYLQGLKSVEAKIDEPFRFTVKVAIPPEPSVLWYRDDQPVDESTRCHLEKEEKGLFNLDIQNLEFLDQAEWKCVAVNDFGHSVTSCFLKLIIPRHYKKPRFLENLQAILSEEGAVNLECKVIGVPQPVLKWYKDGEELKPGDIHRIISGQDGTCCLGTYTCEAQNCMGIAASSASLLGFDDSMKTKKKVTEEQPLQRNLSLSTIHEERTSQMYDTPVGDITLDDKGEISFSFDGKEVSVSLYETPDLTEEEALQIVEMYADQLSENVTEHNVVELPPLRFVKETSTSGNLLMEAIIIDVSPDYFASPEEDLRTEADVEDLSIADENGIPQLSLDQEIEIGGENYLEKTMALLSEEKSDFAAKSSRRKSDSQRSADDFFSLSRDLSLSEDKHDDDTHVSESELQSFASAKSSAKVKSKSSKPSAEEGPESSEPTKTILMKEEIVTKAVKNEVAVKSEQDLEVVKPKRERRTSRGSRKSSTSSEKSISKSKEELHRLKTDLDQASSKLLISDEEFQSTMNGISTSLTNVINDIQLIERDIILKSELMSSAATASRSLEIISSLINPLSEIHSIVDAAKDSISESREVTSTIFKSIPLPLKALQQTMTIIEKCIDMESDNKTLVKKTCVAFIETCGHEIQKVVADLKSVTNINYLSTEEKVVCEIDTLVSEMITAIKLSTETIRSRNLLFEASEIKPEKPTQEIKHMRDTQKAVFELKNPLNSLLRIVESAQSGNIINLSKVKNSEVIMNDMSAPIQDLQTALEQIETLSVKESSSLSLNKYNTEVIETVMDSVLKLRGSFEQLSTEPNTKENESELKETLSLLKENLTEISHKIDVIDRSVGPFEILQSENKLDVLQKMAQILIALENNIPRLETMPIVKSHMDTFHKNLTKVLEKVIESNDAKKYQAMIDVCNTVNIINSSIKNLDSENVLPLASLSNTLKIIQTNFTTDIYEPELNSSIENNISDVLVGIQEAINKAEEMSLLVDSEYIQEIPVPSINKTKVNVILEHIDLTIVAVNTIKVIEMTEDLKLSLSPAIESICPILEELRQYVASVRPNVVEQDENISDISEASFVETVATKLCDLNQNIVVLTQTIIENVDYFKEKTEVISAIAEPLHELHTTLEILQQDVISQYGEELTSYEVRVNIANFVQNLQSCIVLIQEQIGIEGAEEMSTLEDISAIKTSADTLPSDRLVLPTAAEAVIEQSLLPVDYEIATTATAKTLHTLNHHIMVLQTPEIIEALDTLSEISDYASLKSVVVGLGDLHTGIESILHPVPIEGSQNFEDLPSSSKLAAIAEPIMEIQQSLCVIDSSNIPIFENILDLPPEKVQSIFQSISDLKSSLEQCMCAVLPAVDCTNNTMEISNKVSTLREVCEQLKEIFDTSKDAPSDILLPAKVKNLEIVVNSLIDATDVSKDIKIDQVKCITEELYLNIMGVQEDIIQFTTQSPEKISQEAKLVQITSDVEKSIAVLEQYDFIDLSRASDITTCLSPQIAAEIDSESLSQINDIADNAVNVLQDSYREIPIADLMIVEDFFKTCKSEFTILGCLISKATTHKKIIRLLQEFNSLQTLINSFTTKRLELRLSDDVNEYLTDFMIHADECLKNARISLVKIVNSQFDMLIKTPIAQLESINELEYKTENIKKTGIVNVLQTLNEAVKTAKCLECNLQSAIINELSQPNHSELKQEEKALVSKMEDFAVIFDQSACKNLDDTTNIVFEKLTTCINNHQDYKDAAGTGKTLIILKCLAECALILQKEVTQKILPKVVIVEEKEEIHTLKEVLAEMLQPLQALQTELGNIQEQVLSGADKDLTSIDISTTESIMQSMTELHKDIVLQLELDKQSLSDENNITMIQEIDKEISLIQNSIKSIDNVQAGLINEIVKPIDEIEKSLHSVLLAEENSVSQETVFKEASVDLLYHIDQYIELIEIVEEISAVIKLEDAKQTFNIARELRENIINLENNCSEEMLSNARAEQLILVQKLQTALSVLQIQVLESTDELTPTLNASDLKRIAQVTAQLQTNLDMTTKVKIIVQEPEPDLNSIFPVSTTLSQLQTTIESVVSDKTDTDDFKKDLTEHVETAVKVFQSVVAEGDDAKASYASYELTKISQMDQSKTELIPEISTEIDQPLESYSDDLFGSSTLGIPSTVQVNLVQHITEYISEDMVQVISEVPNRNISEEFKSSLNTAHKLLECVTASQTATKDGAIREVTEPLKQEIELAQRLEVALSALSLESFEVLDEVDPSDSKNAIVNVNLVVENLKKDLASLKISHQKVLQFANQQELKTKLETVQLEQIDMAGILEQTLVETTQTIEKETIEFMPIASTSKAGETVALVSTELTKDVTETETIAQETAVQPVEQTTTEIISETFHTKEKNAEKHTSSKSTESEAQVSKQALKNESVDINQPELSCAEENSPSTILAQDDHSSKTNTHESVVGEALQYKDFKQDLAADNNNLDLSVDNDLNLDHIASTSGLDQTNEELVEEHTLRNNESVVQVSKHVPDTEGIGINQPAEKCSDNILSGQDELSLKSDIEAHVATVVGEILQSEVLEQDLPADTNLDLSVANDQNLDHFALTTSLDITKEESVVQISKHIQDTERTDISQQELLSVQKTSDIIMLTQDEQSLKTIIDVDDVLSQVSKSDLAADNTNLTLSVTNEKKLYDIAATSSQATKENITVDSTQDQSNVAVIVTAPQVSVSNLEELSGGVINDKVIQHLVQTTELSTDVLTEAAEDTITQDINTILFDDLPKASFKKQIKTALQITTSLRSYLATSQIDTVDELKEKLLNDIKQANVIEKLKNTLSCLHFQLSQNVLEISPSLSYKNQSAINVVLHFANKLTAALSSEKVQLTTDFQKDKLKANSQTDSTMENNDITDSSINTTKEHKLVSLENDGQVIEAYEDQSLLAVIDTFINSFSELNDMTKDDFHNNLKESNKAKDSKKVFIKNTDLLEELVDNTDVSEIIPVNTKNHDKLGIISESSVVDLRSSFTAGVDNENGSEIIVVKIGEESCTEMMAEINLLVNKYSINMNETTKNQDKMDQNISASCHDEPTTVKPDLSINADMSYSTNDNKALVEINADVVNQPTDENYTLHDRVIPDILAVSPITTVSMKDVVESIPDENLSITMQLVEQPSPDDIASNLKYYIEEYITSGDVLRFAQNILSTFAAQMNEQHSEEIAEQLYESLKKPQLSVVNTKNELVTKLHNELCNAQRQLSLKANESCLINKENLAKVMSIADLLKDEINELIVTSNEVLQDVINEVNEYFTDYFVAHDSIDENSETKVLSDLNQTMTNDNAEFQSKIILPALKHNIGQQLNKSNEENIKKSETAKQTEEMEQKTTIDASRLLDERGTLLQHIDEFITNEINEVINELSDITNIETLKESVAVAKILRESVLAMDYSATAEETSPLNDYILAEQARLAKTLQNALSICHTQMLDLTEDIAPNVSPEAIEKVSQIMTHLQDSLTSVVKIDTNVKYQIIEIGDVEIEEQNSLVQLEGLLQAVNMEINKSPADKNNDVDDTELLKNTLDEVQTVIIKLKREYDGAASDTLNETLDDLECSVRSVQLQISEESPPELLTEACATLQLLVDNMNATQQIQITTALLKSQENENFLDKCSNETKETVNLLEMASKLETKGSNNLENIVSDLKNIKNSLIHLRKSFLVDADTVIENGIEIVQCLNELEVNIFSLEREVDTADDITADTRDCIVTAVHSVYGSISNMRSTVSTVQKRFMFENYGKPSEALLHSIKNITFISSEDEENKQLWKKLSKSLRKVLNHFEDIKFYIGLDKTARLPSDAAFTKIILDELKNNIITILVPRAMSLDSNVLLKKGTELQKCVEVNLNNIESVSSLQVKHKIPMFKSIATEMLKTTNFIKTFIEKQSAVDVMAKTESFDENLIQKDTSPDKEQKKLPMAMELQSESNAFILLETQLKHSCDTSEDKKITNETVEIERIEGNIPLTSDFVVNEVCDMIPKKISEVTLVLAKNVSFAEAATDDSILEDIEEATTELQHASLDIDKTQENIVLNVDKNDDEVQGGPSEIFTIDNIIETCDVIVKVKSDVKPSQTISENEITEDFTEIGECSSMKMQLSQTQEMQTVNLENENSLMKSLSQTNLIKDDYVEVLDKEDLLSPSKEEIKITYEEKIEEQPKQQLIFVQDDNNSEQTKLIEKTGELNPEKNKTQGSPESADDDKQEKPTSSDIKDNFTTIETNLDEQNKSHRETDNVKEVGGKEEQGGNKSKQELEISENALKNEKIVQSNKEDFEMKQDLSVEAQNIGAELMKNEGVVLTQKLDQTINQIEDEPGKSDIKLQEVKKIKEVAANALLDTELKQNEKEAYSKHEKDDAETTLKLEDQNRIPKKEVDALPVKVDTEPKEDNSCKKLETELRLNKDETSTKQHNDNAVQKQMQDEPDRMMKEETDASKAKQDADPKQKEEENQNAKQEKDEAEQKQKKEEQDRIIKEEADALKAKQNAELKQKEEETRAKEEKDEAERKQKKKEQDRIMQEEADALKVKQDAELKQKEKETRAQEEKDEAERKHKKEEQDRLKQEEADALKVKQDAELKQKEEETRAKQEKDEAERKQKKEEQDRIMQEEADALKVKQDAELKQKEKETRAQEEKDEAERKHKKEEQDRLKQEEADALKVKQDAELKQKEEETRAKEEKDEAERKQKKKEQDRIMQEEADALKVKQDAELKQKEKETCAQEEKDEAERKQKKAEQDRIIKEEADALKAKQDAELKQKEKETCAQEEKDEAERKQKKDEQDRIIKKEADALKAKQDADLKLKEKETRAKEEKDETERKQKKKEQDRIMQEEADALKVKQDAELKQKEEEIRAKQEKDEAERKHKEKQDRITKAKQDAELKRKEEETRGKEEKDEAAQKQKKEEQDRIMQEEADALKVKQDAELKQKEEETCAKQEKDEAERKHKKEEQDRIMQEEAHALKVKQDAELKQKEEETRAKQEKDEAKRKQKKEEQDRIMQEEADTLKAKLDAELKRKEEETRAKQEKDEAERRHKKEQDRIMKEEADALKAKQDAELKQKEEETRAKQEKDEAEQKQKKKEQDRIIKEEADALKAKQDAELKEEETRAQKEKDEAKRKHKKEEQDRLKQEEADALKVKQDAELKQKEETRAKEEKDEAERKQKKEEQDRIMQEEADTLKAKLDAELKQKEEETRAKQEKDEAERKQKKEEQDRITKENADALKAKQDAELKQKEEETRAKQEKDEAERKQKKEEQDRITKENADALKAKQDAELKQKEKETRAKQEKDEAERKQKKEEQDRITKENADALKAKQDAELKQKEEETRAKQEKDEAEQKQKKKEQDRIIKEEADALKAKQNAELKQKEEETRAQEEKDEAERKHKKEEQDRLKQEEADALKVKQDAGLKQKEEETRAKEEKDEAERKQKKKEQDRIMQEEADALKVKQDAELKQKEKETRAQEEKDEAERKHKKEEQDRLKQEEADALKVKQDAELKQKEEETRAKQEKDEAERKQKKEEQDRIMQEEADTLKAKQDAELKQKKRETCAKEEKDDAERKQKKEAQDRIMKEEADALIAKQDAEFKQEEKETSKIEEKDKAERKQKKKKADALQGKQDAEQNEGKARALKKIADTDLGDQTATATKIKVSKSKKEAAHKDKQDTVPEQNIQNTRKEQYVDELQSTQDAEVKQNENEAPLLKSKDDDLNKKEVQKASTEKLKDIIKSDQKIGTQTENKDIYNESFIKKTTDVSKKASKYTERLDKSEWRDEETHIYKDSRKEKNENGDVNHKMRSEASNEQHYIREYQYEPKQTKYKQEVKEKPRFVDHNHRDYTMEFARPSGYRERSFDVEKPDSLPSHDYLGRNAAIFRAQTLVLDSQLRSSTHLLPDHYASRTSEPPERRSEVRPRSKAHSEAKTIASDKRPGLSRDSKRKPVFSTYLTDRTAVEGSRVKLTCSVLSSTDPTVTWYKNGVLLDNKLKYRTKVMDGLITMEVLNAVPSDSAEYSCTIQNENGAVNSSATLKVYPSFEASPIPPTFTRSIRDTFHLAENELILECRIRGQPLPTITWLKDDKSISTNSRYQAYYLADGVCRLAIEHPSSEDSGKYTCKAENSVWSDQITHVVNFTGKESHLGPNIATIEKSRFNRQVLESRRPHFTNVLSDYKVVSGGTIGLQVEIRGAPTRVEWLREGCSVTEVYRNAKTFVEQGLYTLALSDVTEKESGMYTCRAWSSQCHVDMNAAITVVQPNELDGKPAIIVGRPAKDILISVGEDINISFRVQGEPKPKVVFMKGIRDITTSQRVCKMTSDDYMKFTLKRSVVSDAGTYCILARNAYGCDRAFVTVVVRQRASSENLISDWTYPTDDTTMTLADRKYKTVPERIPGAPCVVEGGNNWISLGWPKSEPGQSAPVLAYKVESWLLGKEGGARWVELGITPLNTFDAFNLKQGEEYHFRVTPRNRYGWGESVQTSSPTGVGLAGDRPEFTESLPGQLKVLVGETANLSCSVKGTPAPEVVWMKNGHEIEDEDRRISSSFNGFNCNLTIKDINIEDEARYSCESTNVHGRASTYARLAVVTDRSIWEADAKLKRERSADVEGDYPPQFTMRLRDRRVQATYPVRLTCQVIGSPDPRITWFKDGGEVKLDNRRSHFQDEHFHTLEVAPTTLEDGGVYEAMARNSSGAVSCRCNLVVDKGIRAYVAPEFCCGLEPLYRLTDGEELRISAVVEAYPSVGVTWYRDGVRLRPSRRAIMTLDRDGQIELALAAVTSRDAGVYSCTASNEVGRASTSGKVEVIGTNVTRTPPVFISPDEPYSKEPMFIRKPRSSEAREGDTVIIACEVVGDPKPDVYWLRDFLKPDYYRDSSHFKRMGDGPEYRFEIPHAKLDYTGAYSVVARNQYGEAKAVISLQILAKDPASSDDAHNIRYGRVDVLPRFSKELTDLLSCDGDAVEFECRLTGHPEPHVRWFHYHELIRDSSDFETSFDDETARLKIKQVTAEDEGTYTCEAVNNLGKVTSSACLVVYPPGEPNTLSQRLRRPPAFLSAASTPRSTPRSTPARSVSRTPGPEPRRLCSPARTLAPSFYTYPFNKVAEEGDSVSLQCAIKGNPAPWATWDKDGVIITPSSRITIKEKDDVLRILEIDQVTIEDVGVYRITIENEFGRQEASARIEVITQKGKFYAGVRAVSPSPRKSLTYRGRRPSTPRQD